MKYPIGTQTFRILREENMVYVDKTDLVYRLAQKRICFLSRPRRFGKSLLISTLDSYFKGDKELFKGLKIDALEKEWKQHPVLRIDFSQGNFKDPNYIYNIMRNYLDGWEEKYGIKMKYEEIGMRFSNVIASAHEKTGMGVVVLVDEYDKPMLDVLMEPQEQSNRDALKEIYSTFKKVDEHLRFVLLTGVTKFSQVSVFSGFNQPEDISMNPEFDALCGITKDEMKAYFDDEIGIMAEQEEYSKEEMHTRFQRQYDGYHFSEGMTDIFNPFSVINALSSKKLGNYWFASGTPTYLAKLLDRNKTDMQRILSKPYESKYFVNYKADREDPLAMIYQSGYLTIKGYDKEDDTYWLDFPNNEVRNGFIDLLANDYFDQEGDATSLVKSINRMLKRGALDDMHDALTAFFATIPYNANYQERAWSYESHYHYTLYLLFRLLSCFTTFSEKQNSRGRADIVVETPNYVYIFEFKLNGSADEALQQIEDKGYAEPYAGDQRKLFKIGVNFSEEKRNIDEWKVVGR